MPWVNVGIWAFIQALNPLHTLQAGVLRASVFPLSLLIPYPAFLLSWISSIDFLTEYVNLVKSFYRMIWDVD